MENSDSFVEDWVTECENMSRPKTMLETFGIEEPARHGTPRDNCFHCGKEKFSRNGARWNHTASRRAGRNRNSLLGRKRDIANPPSLWTTTVITKDWMCPDCQETPLVEHQSYIDGDRVTGSEITCSFCNFEGDLYCVRLRQDTHKSKRINLMICEGCAFEEVPILDSKQIENLRDAGLKLTQDNEIIKKNQNLSDMEKARPYINSGLRDDFAMAIVKGSDSEQIMNLWDAEWWKQYPEDDKLLRSVLDGLFTVDEGEWLNNIRSDHSRLVMSCIERLCDIAYAKQLVESGFGEHPGAINDILDGGKPSLIARIRKLDISCELPGLDYKIELE